MSKLQTIFQRVEKKYMLTPEQYESLEFDGLFDDILDQYTKKNELFRIKTTNMGSIFELRYRITLKQPGTEKALLDDIRIRNGNLNVSLGKVSTFKDEL